MKINNKNHIEISRACDQSLLYLLLTITAATIITIYNILAVMAVNKISNTCTLSFNMARNRLVSQSTCCQT